MHTTHTHTTLFDRLLSLAQCPAGFSASDVSGMAPETVRRGAEAMVREGRIVRATVSPRRIRYFVDDAQARAYLAARHKPVRPQAALGLRSKAPWRPEDPGLVTAHTKITVAPPLPRNVLRTNTYPVY